MALLFSRNPVYDANKKLFGYDLSYQIETEGLSPSAEEPDKTGSDSDVMVAGFMGMDFRQLASSRRVFLTFSERMLIHEAATLFPKENVIIQIKKDIELSPEILQACRSVRKSGYLLAVDEAFVKNQADELVEMADFIKVDFRRIQAEDNNHDQLDFNRLLNSRRRWVAVHIDTHEAFDLARQYPFSLFQGHFVSRPVIISQKEVPSSHMSHLRLINAIESEAPSFEEISRIIESDPHLSFEILRITNSVFYYRGQKIRSIRQAAIMMGLNELRKWAMVTTLRRFNQQDDSGLVNHCAHRARTLEKLSQKMGLGAKMHEFFTLGLLSMIDTLTQSSMELVLTELAISDDMKNILLGKEDQGEMAECFSLILAYEMGNWSKTKQISQKLDIGSETIKDAYYDSIIWANGFDSGQTDSSD